ncbi:MAG: 23S rRNA (guanosine(2251)-2'-O)-methyltransferase RlmB [Lachnospiraceae bacterium]|nr:23S rRNA (guanosine(2251)-2'-O)-methyltransferase RlmB [Lachnospiraceae bacterium]
MEYINKKDSIVEGKNSVLEAYNAKRGFRKLFVQKGMKDEKLNKLIEDVKKTGTVVKYLEKSEIDGISITKANQGIVAEVEEYKYVEVEDIINYAKEKGEDPFIVILDEIVDPHNFGAIIRSVDAIGAHGIIVKNRNQSMVTSVVESASAGAINYVRIARVQNLTKKIEELKKKGFWFACASMDGDEVDKHNFDGPIGLVMGNEGDGVSRLVKETCDFTISIPMKGHIDSLNVSVATGILLYEIMRIRKH